MKKITKLIFLLILFFDIAAWAKSTDKDAPVHIEANQLEMRERDSVSIYQGNVKITKGSLKITGEKIIIKNKNGNLHQITIDGEPATFFQINDLGEKIEAQSYNMNYLAKTGMLELRKKALLVKNNNKFSSEHIIYNTLEDIVKAGNGFTKGSSYPSAEHTPRVKITLQPENNNSESNNK